jgi:hypothetical protein
MDGVPPAGISIERKLAAIFAVDCVPIDKLKNMPNLIRVKS